MSLATRCIHCGTIFKIVEDQLKVSEGWVRCGRCQEVFNALPTLFDMDSEAPPPRRVPDAAPQQAPVTAPVTPPPPVRPPPPPDPLIEDEWPPEPAQPVRGTTDFELDTRVPAAEMDLVRRPTPSPAPLADPPRRAPLAPPPLPEAELPSTDEADALDSRYLMPSDRDRPIPRRRTRGPEFADAEFPTDALLDAEADALSVTAPVYAPPTDEHASVRFSAPSAEPVPPSTLVTPPAPAAERPAVSPSATPRATPAKKPNKKPAVAPTPEFIRRAQRQAFWRQPSVRGVLTGLALALVLTLGVQVVHQFRDALAAQQPSWRPVLTQWCELAHCTLQPPLRIDDLQVDSATLLRADSEGPDRYRLTVVVRNRATIALAWPHVDLTLTDTAGAVVARRSFAPADAQWRDGSDPDARATPRPSAAPPQRSTTLVWQLRAPTLQPAGYTAELFYP